jgi:hypothetical protein
MKITSKSIILFSTHGPMGDMNKGSLIFTWNALEISGKIIINSDQGKEVTDFLTSNVVKSVSSKMTILQKIFRKPLY